MIRGKKTQRGQEQAFEPNGRDTDRFSHFELIDNLLLSGANIAPNKEGGQNGRGRAVF